MKIQFVRSHLLSCVLLSVAASPAAVHSQESQAIQKPAVADMRTCAKPTWPEGSLRREETGTVTLKFFIDTDGSVSEAIVTTSSGHAALDRSAVAALKKCQFKPGMHDGKARPSWMKMQYVWSLTTRSDIDKLNNELARHREEALNGNVDAAYKMAKIYERADRTKYKDNIRKLYQVAADKKHPAATAEMSNAYRFGINVPKDIAEARRLMRVAAELGHDDSQFTLGQRLLTGNEGEQRDQVQAATWLRKAADQGHSQAQNALGMMYFYGHGVPKDYAEAAAWFKKSAAGGYDIGQRNFGLRLLRGEGVERDPKEAAVWLRKAADQREPDAERELALLYFQGGAGIPVNNDEAFTFLRRAAQVFDPKALILLGNLSAKGIRMPQDQQAASALFRRSAELGNPVGMNSFAYSLETGRGLKQDHAAAMEWYVKAAAQGNADAKAGIGGLYENGLGVEKNVATALKWYTEAANQKSGDGMRRLSRLYETGNGVAQDPAQAFDWLAKAAVSGNEDAMRRLATAHTNGELGVPVNAELGKQWLALADMKASGYGMIYEVEGYKAPAVR
jgi:uncharacterized protein